MPDLHPFFAHFPAALLTVSLLFEAFAYFMKKEDLERAGWWTQLAGTVGLALTILSGLRTGSLQSFDGPAKETFDAHAQMAFVVGGLFAALLLWRAGGKSRLPQNQQLSFLTLFAVGVVVMLVGSFLGGELVYRYGAGLR